MLAYLKENFDVFILYFLGLVIAICLSCFICNLENFSSEKDCYDYYISKNVILPSCRKVIKK